MAKKFHKCCKFPKCFGAIDVKHILIRAPHGSGSYYYNYKDNHSKVLLVICDVNSEFIYTDVVTNERVSDGGLWDNSVRSTRQHGVVLEEQTKRKLVVADTYYSRNTQGCRKAEIPMMSCLSFGDEFSSKNYYKQVSDTK